MDYSKVIYVKKGVYKEKLILPSWLTNITICGEDRDNTIITWDDHANIKMPVGGLDSEAAVKGKPMGTFRTYTLKVQGSYITLKNITIENNVFTLRSQDDKPLVYDSVDNLKVKNNIVISPNGETTKLSY